MGLEAIISIITGILTIGGVIVGLTIHITKLQMQIKQARLEDDLKNLKEKYSDLENKHQTLFRVGNIVFSKKAEIDAELSTITVAVHAGSSSILIPAPSTIPSEEPNELIFLSIIGPAATKLKGARVPLTSIAGYVFLKKEVRIIHKPQKESSFSIKTDKVSKFNTDEMLALPLIYHDRCVGVVELINKKDNELFDDNDRQLGERLSQSLANKVGEFIQDSGNFELLGVTPRRKAEEAVILFCDLSNSSYLSKTIDASAVIDLLNEYFEELCSVGLAYGATIDKFIGDGFMLTFNVPRTLPQHQAKAISAALEMQKKFEVLKDKWSTFQLPGIGSIYNRIGVASGPVYRAEMGHSQYRHITVMGDAVNIASNLCELGDRDRNTIIVEEEIYRKVSSLITVREIKSDRLEEAKGMIARAYEVISGTQK